MIRSEAALKANAEVLRTEDEMVSRLLDIRV